MPLLLDGNLKELDRLTAETACFCIQHGLPGDMEFDLNLVLEELFTNSLNHGRCAGVDGVVEVTLAIRPGAVQLDYADRGAPFNPLAAQAPDTTTPLRDRPDGGLGVHFVRQIMRDCEYQRTGEWNRLRMTRPLPPTASDRREPK